MRRIAVVFLARRGGTARYAAELARGLTKEGFEVLGVTSVESEYQEKWPEKTVFIRTYNSTRELIFATLMMRWINASKAVRRFRPEIILYPAPFLWMPLVDSFMGKAKRVIAIHDVTLHPDQNDVLRRLINRWAFRKADLLVVLSRSQFKALPPKVKTKAVVIPHPIYPVNALGPKDPEPTILFFGRVSPYKGLDVLLAAYNILKKRMPRAKLIIAGEGDLSAYRIPTGVEVHNRWFTRQELARLLGRAWVAALPYTSATQSGVAATAKGAGLLTVGTQVGDLPEQVDLAVPPGNPVVLAEALERALKGEIKPKPAPCWKNVIRLYKEVLP